MKDYLVSPEAENDLRQIWRYLVGEASLAVADRIQDELVDAFAGLVEMPAKGHKRPDLTGRDVLFLSIYQYLIVYRRGTLVEIVAVLHGRRDVKRILKDRVPS